MSSSRPEPSVAELIGRISSRMRQAMGDAFDSADLAIAWVLANPVITSPIIWLITSCTRRSASASGRDSERVW